MEGRLENKIKIEKRIKRKISEMPEYMQRFYYSLGQKSHTTKNVYINNVVRFLLHKYNEFPPIESLKTIEAFDIQMYISEIRYHNENGNITEIKEATQAGIYSSLSAFFTFLSKTYQINNPFSGKMIERPSIPDKPIIYMTADEIKTVENQILNGGAGNKTARSKQENWKYRDILLFRIPLINGLRVTALSEINVDDVDFINKRIRVTEKRNVHKYVDFDNKTSEYIQIWLKQRRDLLKDKKETALFISNRRTRMTARAIEDVIKKYTEECLEGKHITPHGLRRTFGTHAYQQTGDIYLVAALLGHRSTEPTRRYAAIMETDKTAAVNKISHLY